MAIIPAILVAVFASVTLSRGLDTWFSERTRAIVDAAVNVAEAYLRDHAEATRGDVAAISADLSQNKEMFEKDRPSFVRRVARHAALRGLAGVFLFNPEYKRIDVKVTANDKVQFFAPTEEQLNKAKAGELLVIQPGLGGNVVRALMKLPDFDNEFLYVYRVMNPSVIDQLAKTREAKQEYDRLMSQRLGVQLTFALMYGVVGFVFLLAAIWTGLWFSDRLVAPIVRLLDASRRVTAGELDAKVEVIEGPPDLQTLSSTFNLMTGRIKQQRDELVEANEAVDDRRRFTEAMLAGVSAGVIGIDPGGNISLVNRSALNLLSMTEEDLMGKPVAAALPHFQDVFEQAWSRPSGFSEGQVESAAPWRKPELFCQGHHRGRGCRTARPCPHVRRHHRPRVGAAELGLGRHCAAHCP